MVAVCLPCRCCRTLYFHRHMLVAGCWLFTPHFIRFNFCFYFNSFAFEYEMFLRLCSSSFYFRRQKKNVPILVCGMARNDDVVVLNHKICTHDRDPVAGVVDNYQFVGFYMLDILYIFICMHTPLHSRMQQRDRSAQNSNRWNKIKFV